VALHLLYVFKFGVSSIIIPIQLEFHIYLLYKHIQLILLDQLMFY